jgi:peptide/nickel transport system substrate-binding protein
MRLRLLVRGVALASVVGIVAAACGSNTPATTTTNTATGKPTQGGKVVLGAEQWPQCTNPITSCSSSTWMFYTTTMQVLPRAMTLDPQGNFIASPLLTEAPSLTNGGLTQNPFTVTFKINPAAVWSDGTPITSKDFDFTYKANVNTTGSYQTAGYNQIDSVDTTDPHTAVVKYKSVYVDWPDVFGGGLGYLLPAHLFPSQQNSAKPDLAKVMNNIIAGADGKPFSGGPWIMQSWNKNQEVLVRNDKYWGQKPYLDQVTFVPREDQSTEINSLLSGEVSGIYPQPSNVSLLKQFASQPLVKAVTGLQAYYEAVWFNDGGCPDKCGQFGPEGKNNPLVDPKVRQALSYAIDRQSVVDSIIKINAPTAQVLNCGNPLTWPGVSDWCTGNGNSFSQYTYDANKARQILTADGYDCSSTGNPCTKGGKPLTVTWSTTAGNARRASTFALVQPKAKAAGFNLTFHTYEATDLFSNRLPKLNFQIADYAQGGSLDPDTSSLFVCDQIPTAANKYAGGNYDAICSSQLDSLVKQQSTELDHAKRLPIIQQIAQFVAQNNLILPDYQLPAISAWRSDKLAGPIGVYNNSPYGMFFNMELWYCAKQGACG